MHMSTLHRGVQNLRSQPAAVIVHELVLSANLKILREGGGCCVRKCVFLYEEHLVKLVLSSGAEAGNLKLYEKGQGCAARSREVGRLCQSILHHLVNSRSCCCSLIQIQSEKAVCAMNKFEFLANIQPCACMRV